MNLFRKGLIGISLVALVAGCSAGVDKKTSMLENSQSRSEMKARENEASSAEKMGREELSSIDIRLSEGKVELSESELKAGQLEFNVRNETTEPLHLAVIRTELESVKIMVKEGKVDRTQPGVEVLSELREDPIQPGRSEAILETLEPGTYTVVVTAPNRAEPVAYTTLTLEPR